LSLAIQDLGRRHVEYGVKDHHYETVGATLLWTLKESLGAEFTPQAKEAWATVYGVLASRCKRRLSLRHSRMRYQYARNQAGMTSYASPYV